MSEDMSNYVDEILADIAHQDVRKHNRLFLHHKKQGYTPAPDYRELIWVTKDRGAMTIKSMKRSHVQNTLNWCIRKGAGPDDTKDGICYSQWVAFFIARLLDPELE